MPEGPDLYDLLQRSMAHAATFIVGVEPAQITDPTPCDQFDVRDLVGHIVFAGRRIGQAGRRDAIAGDERPVVELADAEWVPVFGQLSQEALTAWSAPGAKDGQVALPFGTFPAPAVLSMYAMEFTTHAWDLAVSTGQAAQLDQALATAVLPLARQVLPPEVRGGDGAAFGPEVAAPAGAGVYDQLAAFMGRNPVQATAAH